MTPLSLLTDLRLPLALRLCGVDLRVGELVPDLDQLRNQRAWAERCVKPTLAHSLAYGHGAQVKGAVSAARLPEPHREI